MMYPSRRGGNDNPGAKEGLYGEVDDVLAAVRYAAGLPWVDTKRIYLGGHSTGGTLALLVAETAPEGTFRAVFSFGPVASTADYGPEVLPFEVNNSKECRLRAPIEFLNDIRCPAFVIEGLAGDSNNATSVEALRRRNKNPLLTLITVAGQDHFSVLGPANALLAAKILSDRASPGLMVLTEAEIQAACLKAKENNFIAAGDVSQNTVVNGVVFYYKKEPSTQTGLALQELAGKHLVGIPLLDAFDKNQEPPFLVLLEEAAPLRNYPVPDADYFRYSGRGMSPEDISGIQATKKATVLTLVSRKHETQTNTRAFNRLVAEFVAGMEAFVWDSATRECFHRDAWNRTRVEGWGTNEIPDIRSQITIHSYRKEAGSGYLRLITSGMEKFGLPDVAVDQTAASDNSSTGRLVNLFCQVLAANPKVLDPAHFPLSLDVSSLGELCDSYKKNTYPNGEGKAMLALMRGTPDEGDPDNALIALDFRHGDGTTDDERRHSVLSRLWGSEDSIVPVRHNEEIEQLSRSAKIKLVALRDSFQAGLPPGSRLMVKSGFPRDDEGREWMWTEVLEWGEADVLKGVLTNDPVHIKALKSGAPVVVNVAETFDYLLYRADGSTEGNETGKAMELQHGRDSAE